MKKLYFPTKIIHFPDKRSLGYDFKTKSAWLKLMPAFVHHKFNEWFELKK